MSTLDCRLDLRLHLLFFQNSAELTFGRPKIPKTFHKGRRMAVQCLSKWGHVRMFFTGRKIHDSHRLVFRRRLWG